MAEIKRFETDHHNATERPGFDLTVRPVKSVSILWALGKPQWSEIVASAHSEAVDEVTSYLEDQAVFSRKRVGDEQLRIATEGLIAAAFDHRTSRAGDPLLHTHVVVFNMTKCVDGLWRSLDGTPLYEHAKTGGYLYQAHLRHVLSRELGLRWTEVINGCAEIEGIPREVIDVFSKRRDEIEQAVAEAGYDSAKARQTATLATRQPKGNEPEPPVAIEAWWAEASALGFTPDDLQACINRGAELTTTHVELTTSDVEVHVGQQSIFSDVADSGVEPFARSVEPHLSVEATEGVAASSDFTDRVDDVFGAMMSDQGLTKMASTFARRDVVREIAEQSVDQLDAAKISEAVEQFIATAGPVRLELTGADSDVVLGAQDGETIQARAFSRFSTPELVSKEARVLAWADSAITVTGSRASPQAVDQALGSHGELSDEQIAMVRRLAIEPKRLSIVVGDPGSGKTYGTGVAVEALVSSGVPVIGATVSSYAGEELSASTDLCAKTGRDASTIAMLLMELDDPQFGGFAQGTVLILDEASMVSTRMLWRLVEHLDAAQGSLVLLGDPNQHGSIEAGGVYGHLVKAHHQHVIGLHDNNRQTDEVERLGISEYREQQIRAALRRYDAAGKIVRSHTIADSYDAMAADWFVQWSLGDRSPMLAGLNTMRLSLNNRARTLLKAQGQLGHGVVVADREFAPGDWVVAKKNNRKLRGPARAWVKNGSTGTVIAVDAQTKAVTVDFEREGKVTVPADYLNDGNLDHAYARTTYGAQGKTLGSVGYHPCDLSGFEEGYVAITRARSGTRIYLVEDQTPDTTKPPCGDSTQWTLDTKDVVRALERKRAKLMAHDIDPGLASRSQEQVDLPSM